MEINVRNSGNFRIVDIVGRIDHLENSIALKSKLISEIENNVKNIGLNLSQVTYLDSGALNVFIYCNNILTKNKGSFCLIEANEYVSDVIEVVGLQKLINVFSTEKDFEKKFLSNK